MDKRLKQNLVVTIIGICFLGIVMNFSHIWNIVIDIIDLILPVIVGCILALFINVPMSGIEKRLKNVISKTNSRRLSDKSIHILSYVLTMIIILLVISLVFVLLIPEIVQSSQNLYQQIKESLPQWEIYLGNNTTNMEWLQKQLLSIDWEQIMQHISTQADIVLGNVASVLSSTISVAATAIFACIISIYISIGKESLCKQGKKLVIAYLPITWSDNLLRFCKMFCKSFSKFLSGQCSEAVILGTLMFLAFTIFQLPYASLVGVLTAVCAIIPYVGAFISCSVSVILTLLISPQLAVRCLIVYLVIQFIENQFIYPHVVGSSVGMPPLYTLIAALIGGKLFGVIGIIFFIPLVAVIIELLKEDASKRLKFRQHLREKQMN